LGAKVKVKNDWVTSYGGLTASVEPRRLYGSLMLRERKKMERFSRSVADAAAVNGQSGYYYIIDDDTSDAGLASTHEELTHIGG